MMPGRAGRTDQMRYVDLHARSFVIEPRYYFYGWSHSPRILARPAVADALAAARDDLPRGFNFKIWDGKRTPRTQVLMRNSFRKRLALLHPRLSDRQLEALVDRFGKKPPRKTTRTGSHLLGGALDLTIVNAAGDELYMGTDHDDLTARAASDYVEHIASPSRLDREVRTNRRLLKSVMLAAAFTPYPYEWWHWSLK
jgi:D-alanyl-D-alanine dipeptidase